MRAAHPLLPVRGRALQDETFYSERQKQSKQHTRESIQDSSQDQSTGAIDNDETSA